MAEPDLKSLKTKSKFKGLFDLGVLSVNSANYIGEEFATLFKDKAKVYCETADYLIALKAEQRIEFRKKVFAKVNEAKWKQVHPITYTHHLLFEVKNDKFGE